MRTKDDLLAHWDMVELPSRATRVTLGTTMTRSLTKNNENPATCEFESSNDFDRMISHEVHTLVLKIGNPLNRWLTTKNGYWMISGYPWVPQTGLRNISCRHCWHIIDTAGLLARHHGVSPHSPARQVSSIRRSEASASAQLPKLHPKDDQI